MQSVRPHSVIQPIFVGRWTPQKTTLSQRKLPLSQRKLPLSRKRVQRGFLVKGERPLFTRLGEGDLGTLTLNFVTVPLRSAHKMPDVVGHVL
jgi:hypothetical protein